MVHYSRALIQTPSASRAKITLQVDGHGCGVVQIGCGAQKDKKTKHLVFHAHRACVSSATADEPTPNASPPVLDDDDTPQWALDLIHQRGWDAYLIRRALHDLSLNLQEHKLWSLARSLNITARNNTDIVPLALPFPRLPVLVKPPAPAAGAPANPPPVFNPVPPL